MRIRPPAVAGAFYPDDADDLHSLIGSCLAQAPRAPVPARAIIAPHAGYIYSGPTAAYAYRALDPATEHVILVGPCHYVPIRGVATSSAQAWRTPLGDIPIRYDAPTGAVDEAHAPEHSLEVHLPFLQKLLGEFTLAPFVAGLIAADQLADVIAANWQGERTAVVISSDLSHYLDYCAAKSRDQATCQDIADLRFLDHEQACGATPVNGMVEVARRTGLRPELLDYRNSGDTAGDRSRVVGYAAFAFRGSDD